MARYDVARQYKEFQLIFALKLISDLFIDDRELAEACLKYATLGTRDGYPFCSSAWKQFAQAENMLDFVKGDLSKGLIIDRRGIFRAVTRAGEHRALVTWIVAQLIAVQISGKFGTYDRGDEYVLKDLDAFVVPIEAAEVLYGSNKGLSARPGVDLSVYDPSAVKGLKLWLDEPLLHGRFRVTVDQAAAFQFDTALGSDDKLKVALIQPNKSLTQLSVRTVSPQSAGRDPHFFGVGPRCFKTQKERVIEGLKLAAAAGAGIVLLPELVMTEALAAQIAAELGTAGNIIAPDTPGHVLKVVVSGSYHHVEIDQRGYEVQRNSTKVLFPRTGSPMLQRLYSKSGKFIYKAPQAVMEAWKHSSSLYNWPAVFTLIKLLSQRLLNPKAKNPRLEDLEFREDVKPTTEIRLYAGPRFSVAVVICADLLDKTFRRVVESLQPSLVLVCNMTPKQGDFASAAHTLILSCQSTLVAANNPATWLEPGGISGKAVAGGMAGLPVEDGDKRVIHAHVPPKKILIFDPRAHELQVYPRDTGIRRSPVQHFEI